MYTEMKTPKKKYQLFAVSLFMASALSTTSSQTANIQVDFSQSRSPVRSMTGFLHGATPSVPSESMIVPLKISLWRTRDLNMYNRIVGLGARMQFILLSGWGEGGKKGYPYLNPTQWRKDVLDTASSTIGKDITWDSWNEPNNPRYWKGTPQQLFETYKISFEAIRSVLPHAIIGGPSLTHYDPIYIKDFLEYCLANKLEVNFLSWHEVNDLGIPEVQKHLQDARSRFLENPRYTPLKIQEITINEFVGYHSQYSPGDILGYLYYLEQGKADRAGKACWPNFVNAHPNNCNNKSLGGLLDPPTFQPRSAWWAYKLYADGYSNRVAGYSTDKDVVPLASKNTNGGAQLLLGSFGNHGNKALVGEFKGIFPSVPISVDFKNISSGLALPKNGKVHVHVERLPNSLEAILKRPLEVQDYNAQVVNNSLHITLPQLRLHEAYFVVLLPLK